MFNRKKGQGTTEYLIILAVIIVIALVVAGVMGWFPGMSGTINATQSQTYWTGASPISMDNWKVTTTGSQFTLKNMSTNKLTLTGITVNDVNVTGLTTTLTAGATVTTANLPTITCATAGEGFSYDVVFTYDVDGGITGNKFVGAKPMVGTCQ